MAEAALSALFDGAQDMISCCTCGASMPKRMSPGPQKKYCEPCRVNAIANSSRKASRKFSYANNGTIPSGSIVACDWCAADFQSRKGTNRYCSEACSQTSVLAVRWRRRIAGTVRIAGQIILCECCSEVYEFQEGREVNRCLDCVDVSLSIQELWKRYLFHRSAAGIADRKTKYWRYYHERKREDHVYVLGDRMSAAIRRSLKSGKEGASWKSMVPYSLADLRKHLEAQFQAGMNWQNYGAWHIDHIRPVSSFDYSSSEDPSFLDCWSLANLRPLWAEDNIKKGASLTYLV